MIPPHQASGSAQQPNPYLPPTADLATAPDLIALHPAAIWARLIAGVVDFIWLAFVLMVGGLIEKMLDGHASAQNIALSVVALGLLLPLVLLQRRGQTPGKIITGIKIVKLDGQRCGLWRGWIVRTAPIWLLSFASLRMGNPWLGLLSFAGYWWMAVWLLDAAPALAPGRMCLHDHIARTRVVET